MESIFDKIEEWISDFLISCITGNLSNMFGDVNDKVATIATEVGRTPESWNSGVFSMIRNLSETVIIPIAAMIIAFVLGYELISMVIDKNSLHDLDTWMFFKWVFKAFLATMIVTHTFDITMAIFDVAQFIIQQSAGVITGDTSIDISAALGDLTATMEEMEVGELLLLMVETWIVSFAMKIMSLCITVILYGRMLEIYLTISVGPVPLSTLANREWGNIGTNYLRGLAALGIQGFFLMVCVGIYAVLVGTISTATDLHAAIWMCAAYTVLLCFALFKTGSLSKSIFNAH